MSIIGKRTVHERMCAQLHFNICRELGVELDNKLWYDRVPKSVETSYEGNVTILWNQQVLTDSTISNNKSDITICDNKQGTCMLIDVAIPADRNVIKKGAEKILKYKDLITEVQCIWNVKATAILVIVETTGKISKSLRKYLSNIPQKHKITDLQNTDVLGTEHTLRKVLM
jgi:hypothetical protein